MGIRERLSGNEAVAFAMKQINPDVMGAFPITPSTEIPQYFSTYVDNGQVAHGIPYAAQTTFIGNFSDLSTKAHKAIYTPGPAFLNVMAPCPRGWRYPSEKLLEVTKAAVETCVWPLYEVVEGKYILSYKPKQKLPVEHYLKMQGRFAHMFKPGNEWMIEQVQKEVDKNWEELLKLCEL